MTAVPDADWRIDYFPSLDQLPLSETVRAAYPAQDGILPGWTVLRDSAGLIVKMARSDGVRSIERLPAASAQPEVTVNFHSAGDAEKLAGQVRELYESIAGDPPMTDAVTVYVSIGNSDDKLTQAKWSEFRTQMTQLVRNRARQVFGDWVSPSSDPWQNACIAFAIDADEVPIVKGQLRNLAAGFGQDSVAWAEVPVTEFVGPSQVLPA